MLFYFSLAKSSTCSWGSNSNSEEEKEVQSGATLSASSPAAPPQHQPQLIASWLSRSFPCQHTDMHLMLLTPALLSGQCWRKISLTHSLILTYSVFIVWLLQTLLQWRALCIPSQTHVPLASGSIPKNKIVESNFTCIFLLLFPKLPSKYITAIYFPTNYIEAFLLPDPLLSLSNTGCLRTSRCMSIQ